MTVAFTICYVAFFWGVLGLAAGGLLALLGRLPRRVTRAVPVVAWVGVVALALRTVQAGHLPIFGTFENTLAASVALVATAAVMSRRRETVGAWYWALPWSLALMLYGTLFSRDAVALTISEQSLWVDVHVLFAWIAFVTLVLASSLAFALLRGRSFWGLGEAEADEYLGRLVNLGFLALTATLVVGSWYLYVLFGVFWKWEIVGTLMLAAWMGYGMVAHARYFYGLGGRALAWAVLGVLPFMFLSFWVWSAFPSTYHFFDIPLVKPY